MVVVVVTGVCLVRRVVRGVRGPRRRCFRVGLAVRRGRWVVVPMVRGVAVRVVRGVRRVRRPNIVVSREDLKVDFKVKFEMEALFCWRRNWS